MTVARECLLTRVQHVLKAFGDQKWRSWQSAENPWTIPFNAPYFGAKEWVNRRM